MAIDFQLVDKAPARAHATGVGICTDEFGQGSDHNWAFLASQGFEGKPGQVQVLPGRRGKLVVALGLGESGQVQADIVRRAAAALARAAQRCSHVAIDIWGDRSSTLGVGVDVAAIVEGIGLASYSYDRYKRDPKPNAITRASIVASARPADRRALAGAVAVVAGVRLARDLVNEPGGLLTPASLADRAVAMATEAGIEAKVLGPSEIEKAEMGGLLGVNRGSSHPPRFVELSYEHRNPKGSLALVGKGITFDSGGLSIKTGQGMMSMKTDMGGAAAVIGAMSVLPTLKPRLVVRGYLPMTDNMLGGDATRPGDVLRIANGKTIEVLNTDAEGRLILADALSRASAASPDAIIDLATLTGACMVALGPKIAGLMGNDDSFLAQVEAAASTSGERVWRLPLPDDYRRMIDSTVADMKNIGGPHGGALTAGLLLREFVGEGIDWAHLDIAGPSTSAEDDGELVRGATGYGVRLLAELFRTFDPAGGQRSAGGPF